MRLSAGKFATAASPPGGSIEARGLEDEHGRLARDTRDVNVHELVADEFADYGNASVAKPRDERDQSLGG